MLLSAMINKRICCCIHFKAPSPFKSSYFLVLFKCRTTFTTVISVFKKKIQIFISLLICSQEKRKIQFKLYLINIPKAIHIHTEGYGQENSTQKLNIGNITLASGLEGRVLYNFRSWTHTSSPGPHLVMADRPLSSWLSVDDCSYMCNFITFSCCKCFIRLHLKCKDHPSLSIPSLCSSLTLHFKNKCGPKMIILLQRCFQNSKNFHMTLTERLQTENYGEIQSPRSSCAEEFFNQFQPEWGLLWAKLQILPELLLFCTSNLMFIRQANKIY